MENLYKFYWDCGRQGELEGKFYATQEEVGAAIGKQVCFGEVLGKHSDVCGVLEQGEIKLVTDNQEFLQMAKDLNIDLTSGFNPLSYLDEDEE